MSLHDESMLATTSLTRPTSHSLAAQEKRFTFNGFTYAAQLWGDPSGLPVIALHGWLDNSASFNILGPMLEGVQCLAVDLAGHGLSDHKAGFEDYPLWSEVAAIYAIADEMGWQQFALVAHSRGAMMSLLIAGTLPDRISHLIMLDAIMPPVVTPDDAPNRMIKSLDSLQFRLNRPLSLYKSYDEAITARCNSRFASVQRDTAEILATRGLREINGGFNWHSDGKLWASSGVALSYDMVMAFARKIAQAQLPSLLLLGDDGLVQSAKPESEFAVACKTLTQMLSMSVEIVDDGHFLHMEKGTATVAKRINQFLSVDVD